MSETKHSPEPWRVGRYYLFAADGNAISVSKTGDRIGGLENRRRIVAAINAVAGIPTAALESGALGKALEALRFSSEDLHMNECGCECVPLCRVLVDALRSLWGLP